MAGTIFEKSTTSLRLWYYAMYLMASTRCGISAKQIQRETGVTYKTAWRMFRQIRSLLSESDMQLEGSAVEMDETYYGGTRKGQFGRPMRGDKKKSPVIGIVERSTDKRVGRLKALATPDVTAERVLGIVHEHVLPKSTVFTDEYRIYDRVGGRVKEHKRINHTAKVYVVGDVHTNTIEGFWSLVKRGIGGRVKEHKRINHTAKVYVVGDVHTNTIEGFWSLVKRGIGGVYHQVSQKYLQSYLDEYSFRYNRRDQGNLIFNAILKRVSELAALPAVRDRGMTPAIAEPF